MNRGINDKKENKALKIIKFAVIAFALVFCGALLLVLFPPTIFLLLAGICVYVMIKNGKKSEQLKQMCTCAVNAQITGFEKREGMDPNNNYNSTSKTLAVYDFMFNNQYFRVKSRDHFYNSSNALIGTFQTIYIDPNDPTAIYEPEQEKMRLRRERQIFVFVMALSVIFAVTIFVMMQN